MKPTLSDLKREIARMASEKVMSDKPGIRNAIGLTKSIIGMCVDEESHDKIRERLWKLVDLLYEIERTRN